jgi:hypothetical protein
MYRRLILRVPPLLLLVIVDLLDQAVAEESDAHSDRHVNRMIMCYNIIIAAAHCQSLVLLSYRGRV